MVPWDEIALEIAGLNGPNYVNNETLAYYLSLFRLLQTVRRLPSCNNPWPAGRMTYLCEPVLVTILPI